MIVGRKTRYLNFQTWAMQLNPRFAKNPRIEWCRQSDKPGFAMKNHFLVGVHADADIGRVVETRKLCLHFGKGIHAVLPPYSC